MLKKAKQNPASEERLAENAAKAAELSKAAAAKPQAAPKCGKCGASLAHVGSVGVVSVPHAHVHLAATVAHARCAGPSAVPILPDGQPSSWVSKLYYLRFDCFMTRSTFESMGLPAE